jgi:hypothetical protein
MTKASYCRTLLHHASRWTLIRKRSHSGTTSYSLIARSIASSAFRAMTVKGRPSDLRLRRYTPQRGWITSRGFHMGNDERRDFPRIPVPKSDAREPALI